MNDGFEGTHQLRVFQKRGRLLFRQRIPEFHFADLGDLAHLRAYAFFFVRRRPARQQKRALCLGEFLRGLQPLLFQKQHVPQQAYLVDVFRQLLPLILQLPLHLVQACEAAFVPVNEQRRGAAGFRQLRLLSPRLTQRVFKGLPILRQQYRQGVNRRPVGGHLFQGRRGLEAAEGGFEGGVTIGGNRNQAHIGVLRVRNLLQRKIQCLPRLQFCDGSLLAGSASANFLQGPGSFLKAVYHGQCFPFGGHGLHGVVLRFFRLYGQKGAAPAQWL